VQKNRVRDVQPARRARLAVILLGVWMLVIIGKLFYLQVWQHDFLSGYAEDQHEASYEGHATRGRLLDRRGRELARSVVAQSVYAEPRRIDDVAATARALAPLLQQPEAELFAKLSQAKNAKKGFLMLARQMDDDAAKRVLSLKLKGVAAQPVSKRVYPNGSLAAHILGFVGAEGQGQAGLENASNKYLQGRPTQITTQKDGLGRVYERWETEAEEGRSLVLTIDTAIQYRVEKTLAEAVARAQAKSGMVVVMQPHTGEILALANAPTFDPNQPFARDAGDPQMRRHVNQALQYVYEPGSTFKIVAYSGAIEEGLAAPDEKIACGGVTRLGNIEIKDDNASGILSLTDALAKSSNQAAITLGRRLQEEKLYDYIKRFGFGERTGIELGGESRGILRDLKKWSGASIASVSIGQEVGITPVQLAAAYAAIANDGVRVTPHLIREIRSPAGVVVAQTEPASRRVVSAQTAATLRRMLEGVTLRGTAKLARLNNYSAAGKTGTAQKYDDKLRAYSKTKHVASFVGFAPAERPAVVIAVVIDEPVGADHGGQVAAPIFRDLAEGILPLLTVTPDLIAHAQGKPSQFAELKRNAVAPSPAGKAPVSVKPKTNGAGEVVRVAGTRAGLTMPDLRGKSQAEAAQICAQLGLDVEMSGRGRARAQTPQPGATVNVGQTVRLEFGGP
jgi:cell division protein FtsI/penicillin-binding protein 2